MSYRIFNTDTQKTCRVDLPNCEITTDKQKYIIQDGEIRVFNLVGGKIQSGDEGTITQQLNLSNNQLSVFNAVRSRDNYTDRLDVGDFEDLDDVFKDILRGNYGDKKTTKLKKVKTKSNYFRYKAKNKATKEVETLEVRIEKPKKKSWFKKTWLGRLITGTKKPKKIEYTSPEKVIKLNEKQSLQQIAENYDIDYDDIVNSNPQLWNMKELKAGKKITIPGTENTKKTKHKVKEGETFESIAKQYNISVKDLKRANSNLRISVSEPEVNQRITLPETKHKTKVTENNVTVVPEHTYTVEQDDMSPSTIANDNDISLYRLALANPDFVERDADGNIVFDSNGGIIFKGLKKGNQLVIPEHKIITRLSSLTIKAIAEETGVTEAYIRDILFGIEGRHSKPDLDAYDDEVPPSEMTDAQKAERRAKGWAIGTPTIGFGHTGRVHGKHMGRNSSEWQNVSITEEEAYLILANDIYSAMQDARAYIGEEIFDNAPQSLQEGLTDIVFNKGVAGFERKNSPCLQLKKNLEERDYVSAAANMIVDPTILGLRRRNCYRVLVSTRSLPENERIEALKKAEYYKNNTVAILKNKGYHTMAKELERDWDLAMNNNITTWFFIR